MSGQMKLDSLTGFTVFSSAAGILSLSNNFLKKLHFCYPKNCLNFCSFSCVLYYFVAKELIKPEMPLLIC